MSEKLQEATIKALQRKLENENSDSIINLKDYSEISNLLESGRAKFRDLQKIIIKLFSKKDDDLINQTINLIEEAEGQLRDFIFDNDLDYNDNNMYMEENHLVSVIIERLQEYLDEDKDIDIDTDFSDEMYS